MTAMDFDPYQLPHRKPVQSGNNGIQSMTKSSSPDQHQSMAQQQAAVRTHAHSRTVSSSIFPMPTGAPTQPYQQSTNHNRRTPSNATNSSTGSGAFATHTSTTLSISLRRSTSSRSGQSVTPTSYVALMRKQKATVWCDRSQHEDPRLVAQAKAAKVRAAMEVVGGNAPGRTSTGGSMGNSSLGVRSKIRHHGGPKAVIGYSPANLVGASVPMRLSASEVGDEDNSDDDAGSQRNDYYQRNGSARSSMASSQRLAVYQQRPPGRLSQGSTPPSGQGSSPADPTDADAAETPMPGDAQRKAASGYFEQRSGDGGSGNSSERESSFGNLGELKAPLAHAGRKENEGKSAEELSRRGSVDERSTSIRGPLRLFVANPDLSD